MDELPVEFAALAGRVNFVKKINDNEYHSSCPNCGGEIHPDGSSPDRFVMWRESRSGTPFGYCIRHCGFKWSPGKEDATWTPEERASMEAKRKAIEEARAAKIHEVAERVTQQGVWKRYHENIGKYKLGMRYWRDDCGFPEEWIRYLQFGFLPDMKVSGYHSPAYTIPVWGVEGNVENVKVRVANPQTDNDRYRNLYKSGAQHLYIPTHTEPAIREKAIILEGEKKAAMAACRGLVPDGITITGVQSKAPEKRIVDMFDVCEVVYLALDPDANMPDKHGNVAVNRLIKMLGADRVRLVLVSQKIDDAIMQGLVLRNKINLAIKPEQFQYWDGGKNGR